jgi:perosamine synthetase
MIPVNRPLITKADIETVTDAISSGWISSEGPYIELFENNFSQIHKNTYGIAVSSGTAALECALYGLGVNKGDEVIIPSFTIVSCAIAVLRLGAIPVFVDVDSDSYGIESSQVENAITHKTKVIMVVHMYGAPVDLTIIKKIKDKYNLKILEDCAQVHGAELNGKPVGCHGDAATFSFYSNKLITTGEGGMVLTNLSEVAERVKSYRNLCFDKERRYIHSDIGNNYRLTNIQAALGYSQTKRIEEIVEIKRNLGKRYTDFISQFNGVNYQKENSYHKHVYWMYFIEFPEQDKIDAKNAIKFLNDNGIGARHFFTPLHIQNIFKDNCKIIKGIDYKVSLRASKYGLYLPSSLDLKNDEFNLICNSLKKLFLQINA